MKQTKIIVMVLFNIERFKYNHYLGYYNHNGGYK